MHAAFPYAAALLLLLLLLLQCEVRTLGDVSLYSMQQLLRIPGVTVGAATLLQQLLEHRFDRELAPD